MGRRFGGLRFGGHRADFPTPRRKKTIVEQGAEEVQKRLKEVGVVGDKVKGISNLTDEQVTDIISLNLEMGRLRSKVSVYEKRDGEARDLFEEMLKLVEGNPGWSRVLNDVRMWLAASIPKEALRGKTEQTEEVCEGRR